MNLNKEEALSIIKKQLEHNPNTSNIMIVTKHKIPLHLIEQFKKIILKEQNKKDSIQDLKEEETKVKEIKIKETVAENVNEENERNEETDSLSLDGRRDPNRKNNVETQKHTSSNNLRTSANFSINGIDSNTQILAFTTNIESISVVDILAGKEIKRIPLNFTPLDIVISPDKRYAYVTYPDAAALGVISIALSKEIARINLNKAPFISDIPLGADVSPDGRFIYVTNYGSFNISIVEARNDCWKVIGEIPLDKRPERIAITPDGRLGFVTLRDDNEIAVIDLLSNLPLDIIHAGTRPIDIAINKNYLGMAPNALSNNVTVFNAALAKASPISIPVGIRPSGVAFNPKGDIAYITNRNRNSVSVIDVFLHKVIDTIPVGKEPIGVSVTKGGRLIAVANSVDNTVSIINSASRKVINTIDVGLEPFWIAIVSVIK